MVAHLCACVPPVCLVPVQKCIRCSQTRLTDGLELPHGCCKLDLGLCKNRALLTAEPSPHPLFLIFKVTFILFSIVAVIIYVPTTALFAFLYFLTDTCYLLSFLITAMLTGERCYLTEALICISLISSDAISYCVCSQAG